MSGMHGCRAYVAARRSVHNEVHSMTSMHGCVHGNAVKTHQPPPHRLLPPGIIMMHHSL